MVRNQDTDRERPEDEEAGEPVEDGVESPRHDAARVLRLPRGHGHIIRPGDGEGGLDKALQETEPATERALIVQLSEGPRLPPIPKAEPVMLRVSTHHDHEGEQDQTDDEEELPHGGPELGLPVPLYGEEVDEAVEHDDDGDDGARGHGVAPVMYDDVARRDLKGHQGGLQDEEVPPRREAEGRINIAAGEADEGRRDGQVGHHLGEGYRDGEDEGTPRKDSSVRRGQRQGYASTACLLSAIMWQAGGDNNRGGAH